jgi:endonuclease/exonuclease/phosphatase family metal-dependent hydrolase
MQLKVLSWNIWIDGHFDLVKDLLRTADADIIALQEVKDNDPGRDVISYLASFGYQHVFSPVEKRWDGIVYRDGCAIFSKYDIISSKTHVLSEENSRIAQQADIKIGSNILHVFSTHLLHTHQKPSDLQALQARNLIKILSKEKTILMGDFNATPESETIQIIKTALKNTDPDSPPTWSVYPEGCAVCLPRQIDIRLDYIFTTPDIRTTSPKVESSKGSDHLPISVMADI